MTSRNRLPLAGVLGWPIAHMRSPRLHRHWLARHGIEGDYISLGWWEREDLGAVVSHLRECGTVSTIGLWGRSMGAVTALLHGDRDPSIAAMVLDKQAAYVQQALQQVPHAPLNDGYCPPHWGSSGADAAATASSSSSSRLFLVVVLIVLYRPFLRWRRRRRG